jgi:hypothetical protein
MTDHSNNQNNQDQSADGQTNVPQDKKPHEVDHNTYWEQPLEISEIEQPGRQKQISPGSGIRQAQEQSSSQFLNQQSSGQQYGLPDGRLPYEQSGTHNSTGTPVKKKSHRVLFTVLATLIILAAGTGAAYAFRDIIVNRLALMTMSPSEYYAYVEKNNVSIIINAITDINTSADPEQINGYAYDFTADVSVNHDTVDSLLQSYLGTGLTDMESLIGIPLNNVTLESIVGVDGDLVNETLGLSLNNIKLATAELFLNSASNKAFLRLPELSPAYLELTGEKSASPHTSAREVMSPERNEALMKRYSSLIINHISRVTQDEDKKLSLDHLSTSCTTLTVVMTAEDLYAIEMDALAEAREDTYIKDLLPAFQMTEEQYQQDLDELQKEFKNSKDTLEDLTMTVYVDSRGIILGRSITSEDSVATVGYTILYDNTAALEYNVFLRDDTGSTVFDITGNQSSGDGAKNGKAVVTVSGSDDEASPVSLDISYEGLHTEKAGNRNCQYGTVTLSSLELKGIQVIMDFGVENDAQICDIDFRLGAESLAIIHTKMNYLEDYTVVTPPEDAGIYEINETEAYLSTFQLEDYISNLSDRFGVNLQSLFDSYMTGPIE